MCCRADKLLSSLECFFSSGVAKGKLSLMFNAGDDETAPVTVPAVYMVPVFHLLAHAAVISEFCHLDFLRLCILLFCLGPPMWVTDLTRDPCPTSTTVLGSKS